MEINVPEDVGDDVEEVEELRDGDGPSEEEEVEVESDVPPGPDTSPLHHLVLGPVFPVHPRLLLPHPYNDSTDPHSQTP